MTRLAKCCCGKTQIEVSDEPAINCVCHCNNCKQRTGSAFGISAYFRHDQFQIIKDSTNVYELKNEQGKQQRHFCQFCGSTLFWYADCFNNYVGVAGGCFTDNPLPQPTYSCRIDNQSTWILLPDSVNRPLTQTDMETH
ncbi:MAG TPA: aldehyde-activating protein [Gammaproteobacteria bacterium]|nr:aldehyde-activating protein [Gammaproteobacteria bacterium]